RARRCAPGAGDGRLGRGERARALRRRVVPAPLARSRRALRAGSPRRAGCRARPAHRARDVRAAQLARGAPLPALARPRPRGSAPEDRRRPHRLPARLMRVAISLRLASEDWEQASAYVVEAERLRADCVWSAEAWGHDAVTPLAFVASRPPRLPLRTPLLPP